MGFPFLYACFSMNMLNGTWRAYHEEIDTTAKGMGDKLIKETSAKQGITEKIKNIIERIDLILRSEAAYSVGFKSQSAYISAFVKNIGYLSSEYKKILSQKNNS